MTRRIVLLPILGGIALSCSGPQIRPAPTAQVLPPGNVAVAESSGVRVSLDPAAWHGWPSDLTEVLTPLDVTLENHSGRAIQIQEQDFQLIGGSGFRYHPMTFLSSSPSPGPSAPPMPPNPPNPPAPSTPKSSSRLRDKGPEPQLDASAVEWLDVGDAQRSNPQLAVVYVRPYVGFRPIVRPYITHYWGPPVWWQPHPYAYWWDWPYPYAYPPYYSQVPLPSQDMVQQALLAGTLEDGGQVSGFLYFPHVIGRESQLTFVAQLPDANTGATVASVTIPLVVR